MATAPRRALGALLVVTALVAAGCGSEDDVIETDVPPVTSAASPPTTAPADTTAPPPTTAEAPDTSDGDVTTGDVTTDDGGDAIPYDAAPETALLRLATGGGFVPMEYAATEIPTLIVYGDGRVLRSGELDRDSSIRPVEELQLDEEGVQALLAAAKAAGLLETGNVDYGMPAITDVPGTTLTLTTADGTATHSAYALGIGEQIEGAENGLTDEQLERRAALQAFIDEVTELDTLAAGHVGPPEPYVPERLAVQAFAAPEDATDGEMKPWPVDDVAPPALDACTVVSGPAAAAAAEALAKASNATTWTLSGRMFRAVGRPILPGEEGCA